MSGFGVWHVLVSLGVIMVPALIVTGMVWLSLRLARGAKRTDAGPSPSTGSIEGRLATLDELRDAGRITEDEYRAQRAAIISGV